MYKKSKYIIESKTANGYVLTNMSNRTTVLLDEKEYHKYKLLPEKITKKDVFINELFEAGLIVEIEMNELNKTLENHQNSINNYNALNITIVPTFNCNFKCSYCYQQDMETEIISEENSKLIIKFIKKRLKKFNTKNLHISWYGGEPLICFSTIKTINQECIDYCNQYNINFTSSISTNLYLLSDEMLTDLIKLKIKRIETTLAGTKDYHNKMRYLKDSKKGTFDKVVSNIIKAAKSIPTIININVSHENIEDIDNLIKFIKNSLPRENIYINFNKISTFERMIIDVKEIKDFRKTRIELLKKCIDEGINICDNTNYDKEFLFCPQQHVNSFSIDSKCKLYKCSEYFDENTCIGYINSTGDGIINKEVERIIKRMLRVRHPSIL